MKNSPKLIIAAIATGGVMLFTAATDITSGSRKQAWEYTTIGPGEANTKTRMENLGQEGWELVTATHNESYGRTLYFKRAKQ